MRLKKVFIIVIISIISVIINYSTGFMFMTSSGSLIFLWLFIYTLIYPISISYYVYKNAKTDSQISFIYDALIVLICYSITFIIPTIEYFNFDTLSFNGDGASKAILKGIIYFGFTVNIVSLIIFYFKLLSNNKPVKSDGNSH
jgi:hypothetical protein